MLPSTEFAAIMPDLEGWIPAEPFHANLKVKAGYESWRRRSLKTLELGVDWISRTICPDIRKRGRPKALPFEGITKERDRVGFITRV